MSERYLLTANFSPIAEATAADRDDALRGVLDALHPAALVEDANSVPLMGGPFMVRVWLSLAGQGEADDSADRIRKAPGLPPVDTIRVRHLGTN
jgi:hypothetical protein